MQLESADVAAAARKDFEHFVTRDFLNHPAERLARLLADDDMED